MKSEEAIAALTETLEQVTEALAAAVAREMALYHVTEDWIKASQVEGIPVGTRATYMTCAEEIGRIMMR